MAIRKLTKYGGSLFVRVGSDIEKELNLVEGEKVDMNIQRPVNSFSIPISTVTCPYCEKENTIIIEDVINGVKDCGICGKEIKLLINISSMNKEVLNTTLTQFKKEKSEEDQVKEELLEKENQEKILTDFEHEKQIEEEKENV